MAFDRASSQGQERTSFWAPVVRDIEKSAERELPLGSKVKIRWSPKAGVFDGGVPVMTYSPYISVIIRRS